jgi:uncharacterized protein YnzC (UPF0291/DUF896 family)
VIQSVQLVAKEAPTVGEYLPAVQLEHAEPAAIEYLPAAQATQAVDVVDPDSEDVPALQLEHTSEPTSALCFPTTHAVHVPPFTPVYPALHRHLLMASLPLEENEFAVQFVHVLYTEAPRVSEYFPAAQSMQLVAKEAPTVAEYFPVVQSEQLVAKEAPTVGEYFPAVQSEHEEPTSEYLPAAQATQAVDVVDPDGEDVPALQLEHKSEPTVALCFPTTHAVHVPPFTPVYPALHRHLLMASLPLEENEFAVQFVHVLYAEAPRVSEYFPAAQSKQELATEAPTAAEYLPAIQPVQLVAKEAPTVGEYFPAVQSEHEEPASEYLPAAQATQAVDVVDPDGEDVPALQFEHTSEPTAVLCFPTTHAVHVPPFTPVYPALHRHPTTRLLPLGESEFAGQSVHVLYAEAPTAAEYLPAVQSMQLVAKEAPTVGEYFPAVQSEHEEPASEYLPAAQATQAVDVVDPDGEDVPALQLEHKSEPTVVLCFPTTHVVHVPPFTPVYPALHRHQTERLLPLGESEFSGQLKQEPTESALRFVEYFPAPQPMQVLAASAQICRVLAGAAADAGAGC